MYGLAGYGTVFGMILSTFNLFEMVTLSCEIVMNVSVGGFVTGGTETGLILSTLKDSGIFTTSCLISSWVGSIRLSGSRNEVISSVFKMPRILTTLWLISNALFAALKYVSSLQQILWKKNSQKSKFVKIYMPFCWKKPSTSFQNAFSFWLL